MLTKFYIRFSLKKFLIRGAFVRKNFADAVGVTSCRPVRRNGIMNNQPAVCSRKFYSHADCAELAEAHLLCVLALREVCARLS